MTFQILIDWWGSGEWTEPGVDVTSRVRARMDRVSVQYGRDQATALAPTIAGRGGFTLDNRSGDYTSRNTSSPLYGNIKPARPVKISRTFSGTYPGADVYPSSTLYPGDSDSTFVLFQGHTDDSPLSPSLDQRTVTVSLVDALADFRGVTISTGLYSGVRTGEAIGYVLDAAGWTGGRDLDSGGTFIPWWWEDGGDALEALERIVRSEGPPALLTVGGDGSIIFKDRHHRLTNANTLTVQDVWSDTAAAPPTIHRESFSYDEAWRNIVNTGAASIGVRTPGQIGEVWTTEETVDLAANASRTIVATASDPFYDAQTPVDGTDYTTVSGGVTVTLSRTSGQSTTITVTAGGTASKITGLRLRARPVATAFTVTVEANDEASVNDYGKRSFPGDLPWCNPDDARSVLDNAVAIRAQPLPIVSARLLVGSNASLLARDLSDRVTVNVAEIDLAADFYLENIQHDFTHAVDHAVMFGLEAAPTFATPIAVVDLVGAGVDVGHVAPNIDNPSDIALVDSADTARLVDAGKVAR